MPLDPLTALGLAANIVQFIEFCDNLSVKAYEIYKATEGLTKDHEHHQNLVQSLAELSGRLKLDLSPTASPSANDQALQDLAQKCEKEANDLLSLLKSLAVPGDSSVWRSTQQAFRGLRKNDKIKSLSGRLKDYRGQISVLLLAILRYAVGIVLGERH